MFNPKEAIAPSIPTFKFERVGDGLKFRIEDFANEVEFANDKGGIDKFVRLDVTVLACKGGDKDENTDEISDTPIGEQRRIYLRYARDGRRSTPSQTRALAEAMVKVGADVFRVGDEGALKHTELGPKDPKNPQWNRPKIFTAAYEAKNVSPIIGSTDEEDPF